MQVYRELRVLTARPSDADMATAPHRLYGMVPAREAYSVGRWTADAAAAIAEARCQRRVPILVGGTGLYFKAVLEGLSPVPEIPEAVRERWRTQASMSDARDLHEALSQRDEVMAARLPPTDPQRIVRALEVIDATGVSLADFRGSSVSEIGMVLILILQMCKRFFRLAQNVFSPSQQLLAKIIALPFVHERFLVRRPVKAVSLRAHDTFTPNANPLGLRPLLRVASNFGRYIQSLRRLHNT